MSICLSLSLSNTHAYKHTKSNILESNTALKLKLEKNVYLQNVFMLFDNDLKISVAFSNSWLKMEQGLTTAATQSRVRKETGSLRKLHRLQGISGGNQGSLRGTFMHMDSSCLIHASFGLLQILLSLSELNANWLKFQFDLPNISLYQGAGEVFQLILPHLVLPGSLWNYIVTTVHPTREKP